MQIAFPLKLASSALIAAVVLSAYHASRITSYTLVGAQAAQATVSKPYAASSLAVSSAKNPAAQRSVASTKTEAAQGEFVGGLTDCDGDGVSDDSRIDFDGDGISDECVDGVEAIPEPPFQQSYTPTSDTFSSLLPAVGWQAVYQCGEDSYEGGLYEVSLSRIDETQMEYRADDLTLTSEIVYDDLDPNLNQPLIIRDPEAGIRYTFTQEADGEFYEYAIADYDGQVGLYVYQMGEQIVATPCETDSPAN